MKLLLTSAGVKTGAIKEALHDMLGKPFAESNVVFIPTAANLESGDKRWLIDNLNDCIELGFKEIVDDNNVEDMFYSIADDTAVQVVNDSVVVIGNNYVSYNS